jgi:anti-sigma B factor antagonist
MLSVHLERNEDGAVLSLSGELDMATAPALRQAIVGAVSDGATDLVLDLGEVSFCDSVGLGIIVGGLKRARSHGGDLRLRSVPARLAETLTLTGLDRAITVESSAAAT